MGDENDPSVSTAPEDAPPAAPSAPLSVVPRPVSVPPRPLGGAAPTSRMPPPPSSRGIVPGPPVPGALRSPLPPPRQPTPPPAASSVVASPSVVPRAPATPPPPPQRHSAPPGFLRPSTQPSDGGAGAQLEQRLGATQVELRKLGSERHTLRARLRREADRLRELESALRAEKELRTQASDEHFAAILGLRARLAEVETERLADAAALRSELERARSEVAQAQSEVAQAQSELERAQSELVQAQSELVQAHSRAASNGAGAAPALARASKAPQGLRRIRGIGPGYERVLEQVGVTRVQQIARWTEADVLAFADKLKIRPDRISKDAWVAQAQALEPDPDD